MMDVEEPFVSDPDRPSPAPRPKGRRSSTGQPGKDRRREAAREKARALREAEQARQRRRRRLVVAAAAAAVLIVVVAVGAVVQAGRSRVGTAAAAPAHVVDDGIVTGDPDAPATVTIYLDYQCPACKQLEQNEGPWLDALRDQGRITIDYHPIAILDRYSSTRYSTRAANAAACVADSSPEVFPAFNDALFAAQPPEGGEGLPDAELVRIARSVGAPDAVEPCITGQEFAGWVAAATERASKKGVQGTPTVLVDGRVVPNPTRQALEAAIAAASG
jgi:protein-disulfide isomerase